MLQIQLTGFLDKDTPKFCKELWTLCLSAQSNPQGVPKELLEAKKLELIQEKVISSMFLHKGLKLTDNDDRSKPKKRQKRRRGKRSKKRPVIKTSSRFGNVNAVREDGVAVAAEAIGVVMISREERGNQDPHHLGAGARDEAHADDLTTAPPR